MSDKAVKEYVQELTDAGLEYEAEFVPLSQSGHFWDKDAEGLSLNWRVTISIGGLSIEQKYSEGIGHIPGYCFRPDMRTLSYSHEVEYACEHGYTFISPSVNPGTLDTVCHVLPKPKLESILYCIVIDASTVLDTPDFETWARDLDMDTDSIKSREAYDRLVEMALKLRHMIDIDEAVEVFRDY